MINLDIDVLNFRRLKSKEEKDSENLLYITTYVLSMPVKLQERTDKEVNFMEKIISDKNILLLNLDKLHTTELGVLRIKKNLSLDTDDVVKWCGDRIKQENAIIEGKGKNWYANVDKCTITVNAHSYTIITAHKNKVR